MLKVYNRRRPNEIPKGAVYIGRPTQYGNPFSKGSKAQNIADFEVYAKKRLQREPNWLNALRGKHLVCWCAPAGCHGDILIEMANEPVCAKPEREPEIDWDAWCKENEPDAADMVGIRPSDWEVQHGLA